MKKLIFGMGQISVAHATIEEKECLLLEPSKGYGAVGAGVRGRKKGMIIEIDKDAVILEFNCEKSAGIVIEALIEIRKVLNGEKQD